MSHKVSCGLESCTSSPVTSVMAGATREKEFVSANSRLRVKRARLGELGGGLGVMAGATGEKEFVSANSRAGRVQRGRLTGGTGTSLQVLLVAPVD